MEVNGEGQVHYVAELREGGIESSSGYKRHAGKRDYVHLCMDLRTVATIVEDWLVMGMDSKRSNPASDHFWMSHSDCSTVSLHRI